MHPCRLQFAVLAIIVLHIKAHQTHEYIWTSRAPLPSPRSDLTATVVLMEAGSEDGERMQGRLKIFLIGGCASRYSNLDTDMFHCTHVSDSVWLFDPEADTYQTMAPMPTGRFRHTSTLVWNDKIFVIGGRDAKGVVVDHVDVYHIYSNSWERTGRIKNPFSGHGAFFIDTGELTGLCMIGGWYQDYSLRTKVECIDVVKTTLDSIIGICDKDCLSYHNDAVEPMTQSRGDIYPSLSQNQLIVFVAGGLKQHNDSCISTLGSTEIYDVKKNSWSFGPELPTAQSSVQSVILDESLFTLGGEFNGDCESVLSIAHRNVQKLSLEGKNGGREWISLPDMPRSLSRFAASADAIRNSIFVFGGRTNYIPSCDCHETTSDVFALTRTQTDTPSSDPSSMSSPGLSSSPSTSHPSHFASSLPFETPSILLSPSYKPSQLKLSSPSPSTVSTLPSVIPYTTTSPSTSINATITWSGSTSPSVIVGDQNTISVLLSVLMDPKRHASAKQIMGDNEHKMINAVLDSTNDILCLDTDFRIISDVAVDSSKEKNTCKDRIAHQNYNRQRGLKEQLHTIYIGNPTHSTSPTFSQKKIHLCDANETLLVVYPYWVTVEDREERLPWLGSQGESLKIEWLAFTLRYQVLCVNLGSLEKEDNDERIEHNKDNERGDGGGEETHKDLREDLIKTELVRIEETVRQALELRLQDGSLLKMLREEDPRILEIAMAETEKDVFSPYAVFDPTGRVAGGFYDPVQPGILHPVRVIGVLLLCSTAVCTSILLFLARRKAHVHCHSTATRLDHHHFHEHRRRQDHDQSDATTPGNLRKGAGLTQMLESTVTATGRERIASDQSSQLLVVGGDCCKKQ